MAPTRWSSTSSRDPGRNAVDAAPLARQVHDLLLAQGQTVATAESLTGGWLAAALTHTPGASQTYVGGVVAYATSVKTDVLGVRASVVEAHGVVSSECAVAMARGVAALTRATYAVSTTGVAGPDHQEGHPPGTVYVGIVGPGVASGLALELVGSRSEIMDRTCVEALAVLVDVVTGKKAPLR